MEAEKKALLWKTVKYVLWKMSWVNIIIMFLGFAMIFIVLPIKPANETDVWGLLNTFLFGALFVILGCHWWQAEVDHITERLRDHPELLEDEKEPEETK